MSPQQGRTDHAERLEALRHRLASLRGIGEAYFDHRGELRHISPATRDALLRAMGCDVHDATSLEHEIASLESERWRVFVPPISVVRPPRVDITLALPSHAGELHYELDLEDGRVMTGTVQAASLREDAWREIDGRVVSQRRLQLLGVPPPGYHVLRVATGDQEFGTGDLVVAPERCFEPAALTSGARVWGLAAQLYTLRSERNWGIGDFADLRALVTHAASCGAAFVGVNPLHALFSANPAHSSPYSPSSRQFLNVLYIAIPDVPGYDECAQLRRELASQDSRRRLAALRDMPLVDYAGVSRMKLPALERLYMHFRERHLASDTPLAQAFREYRRTGGEALRRYTLHEAIDRRTRSAGAGSGGWPTWPADLRDPAHEEVASFEREHPEEVEFHAWLQWVADEQLASVQQHARALGMSIGLYGDYAVGVNPAGAETWANQHVYRTGAAIGAPPDPLALKGQDWGIPPQDPHALVAARYRPFRRLIEANLRRYGALRVDHVMSLFRQWWVPAGSSAVEGGYVHYPLDALMSVLTLESVRHRCLVVGEDLGTVPDEVRRAMADFGVYHYRVLLFEKEADGHFRAPQHYARRAIAAASTHDLPTLRGYWSGSDLALRDRLQLYPDAEVRRRVHEEREIDRARLRGAIAAAGLFADSSTAGEAPSDPPPASAVHAFIAGSAAALVALQLEDLIGMDAPVNVPGTLDEYPNWQRKLTRTLEELFADEAVLDQLRRVRELRTN